MTGEQRVIVGCLTGVAISLLLVGIVSGTLIRHLIQIVPLLLAGIVVARRPCWGSYAAMPLFLFWAEIMTLIWLYLLGISRIASGRYGFIEIVLTVLIALLSVAGVWTSSRLGRSLELLRRLAVFVAFGALQIAAMTVSFLESFANR